MPGESIEVAAAHPVAAPMLHPPGLDQQAPPVVSNSALLTHDGLSGPKLHAGPYLGAGQADLHLAKVSVAV